MALESSSFPPPRPIVNIPSKTIKVSILLILDACTTPRRTIHEHPPKWILKKRKGWYGLGVYETGGGVEMGIFQKNILYGDSLWERKAALWRWFVKVSGFEDRVER